MGRRVVITGPGRGVPPDVVLRQLGHWELRVLLAPNLVLVDHRTFCPSPPRKTAKPKEILTSLILRGTALMADNQLRHSQDKTGGERFSERRRISLEQNAVQSRAVLRPLRVPKNLEPARSDYLSKRSDRLPEAQLE